MSRGSVYEDGQPCGLYLAALHHCRGEASAMLGLALRSLTGGPAQAVHLRVRATRDAYEMVFVEPTDSPWRDHGYLGQMLRPPEARASDLRERFFHVAEHVIRDIPEVREYFASTA